MTNSPYKNKEIEVDLPTIGKTIAIAHVERGVVFNPTDSAGFSHLSFPVEAHLNEPELQEKADSILYLLNESFGNTHSNEFDDGVMTFTVKGNTDIEINDDPLYQVVLAEKLADVGPYDIHDSAILTQNPKIASALLTNLTGLTSLVVRKKTSELSDNEVSRVTNNYQAAKLLASLVQTLDSYNIKGFEQSRDVDEIIVQSIAREFPEHTKEVQAVFNEFGSVANALLAVTNSSSINKIVHDDFLVHGDAPASPSNTLISMKDTITANDHGGYTWERDTGEVSTLRISEEHGVSNVFDLGRHTDMPKPETPAYRR